MKELNYCVRAKTKLITVEFKLLHFPLPVSLAGEEDASACSRVCQSQAFFCGGLNEQSKIIFFFFFFVFGRRAACLWSHVLVELNEEIFNPFEFFLLFCISFRTKSLIFVHIPEPLV